MARLRGGNAGGGEALFAACAACHGADASGNAELGSPPLRGREDWYVANQLEAFCSGSRGTHPDDPRGREMRAAAAMLDGQQDALDVVAYLAKMEGRDTRRRR